MVQGTFLLPTDKIIAFERSNKSSFNQCISWSDIRSSLSASRPCSAEAATRRRSRQGYRVFMISHLNLIVEYWLILLCQVREQTQMAVRSAIASYPHVRRRVHTNLITLVTIVPTKYTSDLITLFNSCQFFSSYLIR